MVISKRILLFLAGFFLLLSAIPSKTSEVPAVDPGVRGGLASAGQPLPGLNADELTFFNLGSEIFSEVDSVSGGAEPGYGLGPRFNMNSCSGCHAHPAVGGSSPFVNPQVAVASLDGATNKVPFFITVDGPVRAARFKLNPDGTPDGGVHALFTVTGRFDAPGCNITQPNFDEAAKKHNLIFRIPTPVFGGGLITSIPDAEIIANMNARRHQKHVLGIDGHPNLSGNDGTITRFGWKAQNKSLLLFAGEAYNAEQGVTNELFPQERDETPGCLFNPLPEDRMHIDATRVTEFFSDIQHMANFMMLLAPPEPVRQNDEAIQKGLVLFSSIGCGLCHTPNLNTGATQIAALSNKVVNLFSDLLLHKMGDGLADDIGQGGAGPSEFRTAPLWGLGQRIFFLHDGRTKDLLEAIQEHKSPKSEANKVVDNFNGLRESDKQRILDFLRSL